MIGTRSWVKTEQLDSDAAFACSWEVIFPYETLLGDRGVKQRNLASGGPISGAERVLQVNRRPRLTENTQPESILTTQISPRRNELKVFSYWVRFAAGSWKRCSGWQSTICPRLFRSEPFRCHLLISRLTVKGVRFAVLASCSLVISSLIPFAHL